MEGYFVKISTVAPPTPLTEEEVPSFIYDYSREPEQYRDIEDVFPELYTDCNGQVRLNIMRISERMTCEYEHLMQIARTLLTMTEEDYIDGKADIVLHEEADNNFVIDDDDGNCVSMDKWLHRHYRVNPQIFVGEVHWYVV